jgi:hypothetical protein
MDPFDFQTAAAMAKRFDLPAPDVSRYFAMADSRGQGLDAAAVTALAEAACAARVRGVSHAVIERAMGQGATVAQLSQLVAEGGA